MAEGVITTDQGTQWIYSPPPDLNAKVLLLTQGGIALVGAWGTQGDVWGWAPLPKRNKKLEEELGLTWLT